MYIILCTLLSCNKELYFINRQIVKLTQLVGEVDIQLNTALEENEALKQKLGMTSEDSVDLSELRHKKNVQLEQLQNMNRDLSQEVWL